MVELHYAVAREGGRWTISSDGLRLGSYGTRVAAEQAALRLGRKSCGLPFHLHVQDEPPRFASSPNC